MKLVSNQITLKEAEDRIKKADIETAIKILDDIALQDNIEAQLKLAEILYKEEQFSISSLRIRSPKQWKDFLNDG